MRGDATYDADNPRCSAKAGPVRIAGHWPPEATALLDCYEQGLERAGACLQCRQFYREAPMGSWGRQWLS